MDNAIPPAIPKKKTLGLATTSLVFGIVSLVTVLVCIGPLFGIPAAIMGHVAMSRIKKAKDTLEGEGVALAGLIMGYIAIVAGLFIIPLLAAIAIPSFVKARNTAQQNACINNLRHIDSAKEQWAIENKKEDGAPVGAEDIKKYLGRDISTMKCPANGIYKINPVGTDPECSLKDKGHDVKMTRGQY